MNFAPVVCAVGDFDEFLDHDRQERANGHLRGPRLWKMADFKVGDEVVRTLVPTQEAIERFSRFPGLTPRAHTEKENHSSQRILRYSSAAATCDAVNIEHAPDAASDDSMRLKPA
jgi:hypothetical protein